MAVAGGNRARCDAARGGRDRGDVRGRGAAAAADGVDETAGGELAEDGGHLGGRLIVAAERIRQAGIRVAGDVAFSEAREFLDIRAHGASAERAVDADGERLHVADRVVECRDRLAGERAAGGVGDRDGNHHRHAIAALVEDRLDREQGGLGVERVEDGFNEQRVDAAVEESVDLFAVGLDDLVPRDGPEIGAVDVGRHRERAIERTDRAGDETAAAGRGGLGLGGGAAGDGGGGEVDVAHEGLELVVGLRNRGGVEGVRFDQVGAGGEIRGVNLLDDVGAREAEQVVVALEIVRMSGETFAAEVGLRQVVALDHRAHRAVEDHEPGGEQRFERAARGGGPLGGGRRRGGR